MQTIVNLLVCLLFICGQPVQSQSAGERCTIETTGQTGTCRLITQCPAAIAALQQRIPPKLCGFQGSASVVCCPETVAVTTTTTTQRTTTLRASPTTKRVITTPIPTRPEVTTRRLTGEIGEKSAIKCQEYGKYVYVQKVSQVSLLDDVVTTRTECAQSADVAIVGGQETVPKEFPHMALVGYDSSEGEIVYKCGGSLISENFVLTAAHCLYDRETASYVRHVRLGERDQGAASNSRQNIIVSQYIKHPEYRPPSKYNDIALLRLERKAVLNDFVRPACLPTKSEVAVPTAVATGWGRTAFSGDTSSNLLKVTLDMYSNQICNNSYEIDRKLNRGIIDTQICAGSFNDTKDACQGDSGGPLQISNTRTVFCTYTIVGVTSFGKACGIANQPGVYTRVYSYLGWIESIVWPTL